MKFHRLPCSRRVILPAFIAFLVSALNGPLTFAQNANHSYAELEKAPENARMRQNPLAGDSNAVAAGRKLFGQHCAVCHGKTGDGGRKGPSLRAQEVRNATPGMLFWILTNGVVRRGMPVWSKLPEQQRWQIVSYLKSLD